MFVLVCFSFIFLTSFLKKKIFVNSEYRGKESPPLIQTETRVLGEYSSTRIIVSGGDGYSSGGVISLASTDEPAVYLTSYGFSGEAEISVYRADEENILDYLLHDNEGKQLNNKPDYDKLSLIQTFKQNIISGYDSKNKVLLPLEENGIYLLVVKTAGKEEYAFVFRSDYGVLVKQGNKRLIFWAQSFETKRKISGGKIKVYNLSRKKTLLEESLFDGDGIASANLNPDADLGIVEFEGKLALVPINLRYMGSSWRRFYSKETTRYFVFTDRTLYQPGDKVYFKAILRDDDDARYSLPSGTANVKIYKDWDEKNNVLFEKNLSVSDKGSVYGEYQLPKDVTPGDYQLKVDTGKKASGDYYDFSGASYITFQVQYYRKPEYSLEIETDQKELITGDRLYFKLKGSYFSGQPVSGQTIKYSIFTSDFYNFEYYSDYSFLDEDGHDWVYYGNQKIKEDQIVLDKKGEAKVEIETKNLAGGGKDKIFIISAEMDNGSGNPSVAKKNVLVYAGDFNIFRKNYGYQNKVNEELSLPLVLRPHQFQDISNISLKVKVQRKEWVKYYVQDQKYPQYREEKEDYPEMNIVSDSRGEAEIRFLPTKAGSYTFSIEGVDKKGNLIANSFYTWVTNKDYSFYSEANQSRLTIKQDKAKYKPNEKVKLAIFSEIPDRDIFLSFERGRLDRFQTISLTGTSVVLESSINSTDLPNIYAVASSFSDSSLESANTNILVSAEEKKIKVELTPDRKEYGPGETVVLNVLTKDIGGNPVAAEVAVWAIDKALFELLNQEPAKIFERFWGERGYSSPTSHSLVGIVVPGAEGGGCFDGETPILLENGKEKKISGIAVGENILTRDNNNQKSVKAKVKAIHKTNVSGYLIINGNLKVTENHYLRVNDDWREAGSIQKGDWLTDIDGQKTVVRSLEYIRGKFMVYNLEIEKYHTYFAGGVWVHNQKGDGEGRTVFKDAAYWNPTVQTDSSGLAKLTFKLPDNLTTWVISGIAASNDTKVGQQTTEIVVSKDVIVRPILPNIVRLGDRLSVSALVQNFTQSERNFLVNLNFGAGDIEEPKEGSLLVPASETQTVSWWINPKKENEAAEMTFSAVAKEDAKDEDKLTLTLPVMKYGFKEKRAMIGEGNKDFRLNLSPDVDKEKSKVTLSLSPSLHGSLLPAMKYLIYYPYGCVEQITSTFVPAVIAKEKPDLFKGYLENEDIDKNIKAAITKLQKMQKIDGSFGWWGNRESSAFVTAYVVEYLSRAQKLGFDDRGVLDRAKNYLISKEKNSTDSVSLSYGLSFLGENKELLFDLNKVDLPADILALAVMSNVRNSRTNPETNGLNVLISLAKEQGEGIYWDSGNKETFGSNEASTALAARALMVAGADRNLVTKAIRFLLRSRKFDYWANSFATAQIVQLISDYATSTNESTPEYSYSVSLDGEIIKSGKVQSTRDIIKDIIISASKIKSDGSNLSVSRVGEGQIYSTLLVDEWHTDENAVSQSNGLTIKREYLDKNGDIYKTVGIGDEVTVRLTVSGLSSPEYYGVLTDELPAGLIPINDSFLNEQYPQSRSWYAYYDMDTQVTKNGAVLSLYRVEQGSNVYTYRARAVAAGKFLVPPAEASLMYSPEIWGRTEAGKLEITDVGSVYPKPLLPGEKLAAKSRFYLSIIAMVLIIFAGSVLAVILKKRKQLPPPLPPTAV